MIQPGRLEGGTFELSLIVAPPSARGKGIISDRPSSCSLSLSLRSLLTEMKKRRWITKLTVETERTFIFRNRGPSRVGFCNRCGSNVELTCVADAALEAGCGELAIYELIRTGSFHFVEEDGHVLVCLGSLRRIQRNMDGEENERGGEL